MTSFRVLVCGGRDYRNWEQLYHVLSYLAVEYGFTEVIHGAARGADTMADQWASMTGLPARAFPANWALYRNAAGAKRNQQMLDEGKPDLVVAFPGGDGTADMVRRARAANIRVIEVPA